MIERFVNVGEVTLHYFSYGEPSRETLMILHGVSQSSFYWSHVAARLQEDLGVRVILVDQRGHGLSSHPQEPHYSCNDYLKDLSGVIGALNLANLHLLGHSMGAYHALLYGYFNPKKIRSICYIDIEPRLPEWQRRFLADWSLRIPKRFRTIEEAIQYLATSYVRPDLKLLREILSKELKPFEDGALRFRFDARALTYFDSYDVSNKLEGIACPTLVLRGEKSNVTRRESMKAMASCIPQGTFAEIPSAGHNVHIDAPIELCEKVTAFLRGVR